MNRAQRRNEAKQRQRRDSRRPDHGATIPEKHLRTLDLTPEFFRDISRGTCKTLEDDDARSRRRERAGRCDACGREAESERHLVLEDKHVCATCRDDPAWAVISGTEAEKALRVDWRDLFLARKRRVGGATYGFQDPVTGRKVPMSGGQAYWYMRSDAEAAAWRKRELGEASAFPYVDPRSLSPRRDDEDEGSDKCTADGCRNRRLFRLKQTGHTIECPDCGARLSFFGTNQGDVCSLNERGLRRAGDGPCTAPLHAPGRFLPGPTAGGTHSYYFEKMRCPGGCGNLWEPDDVVEMTVTRIGGLN